MNRPGSALQMALFLGLLILAPAAVGPSLTERPTKYPLWNFGDPRLTCRDKGRLPDEDDCFSHLMDRIIADGEAAIPVLISQLTETRSTKEPIYNYWSLTTSGDVAYFILTDLFTDSDWKTLHTPGLESLQERCDSHTEDCWQRLLKKHGGSSLKTKG